MPIRRGSPFKVALVAYYDNDMIQWLLKADWRIAFLDKNGLVIVNKSIIPSLSKEALAQDVSTNRFKDVDNPSILRTLFNFYVHLSPAFGEDPPVISNKCEHPLRKQANGY